MIQSFFNRIGPLRGILLFSVALFVVLSQITGDPISYSGWQILPTLIVPAIAPILFFVLGFDLMMSSILAADRTDDEKARFHFIVKLEAILLLTMLLSWLPYFLSIGS
ncbi:MAG: hypothetical protein BMS9Abin36_1876 [Gammaproteobacteria bacterium]|nr:MAG: hypothetical protein BMS9Abin36_1876 [Gammaproteobacteria bacterium]